LIDDVADIFDQLLEHLVLGQTAYEWKRGARLRARATSAMDLADHKGDDGLLEQHVARNLLFH
jgi:hypothetical protein